jgi:protein-L-isoaspartate(D-aspartate) O-methyltransferase
MTEQQLIQFFRNLDRSYFIEGPAKDLAGLDQALPIGHGQTISQPSLVVEMTWHLGLEPGYKVLEIGTGSGYQTAFLAEFGGRVYSVERLEVLAAQARERLKTLGYKNITFRTGDGSSGWPDAAPFDRIIVTAAALQIPEELVEQLACNGRMILPVGSPGDQDLLLIQKDAEGRISRKVLTKVVFVELVGKYGWT